MPTQRSFESSVVPLMIVCDVVGMAIGGIAKLLFPHIRWFLTSMILSGILFIAVLLIGMLCTATTKAEDAQSMKATDAPSDSNS